MVIISKLPDILIPTNLSLPDFITQRFSSFPDGRKVIIDPAVGRSYTCSQLISTMNQVAAGFQRRGLNKGDVVAIYLPNIAEYPIIMYGIMCLGAIPTTFNPLYTAEEIKHQIKDSRAKYVITVPSLVNKVSEVLETLSGQIMEVFAIGDAQNTTSFFSLIDNNGKFTRATFDPCTTTAVIPYSSGTTGLSKGVELTHFNVVSNTLQLIAMHVGVYREMEVYAAVLPFFHIYGMVMVMGAALLQGFTLVVLPKFELQSYLQIIQEYRVTVLPIVPPIVITLSKDASVLKYDLSSVRVVICGAAPMGADLESAFKSRLKGVTLIQAYGMTELSPLTHSTNVFIRAPGTVGQLVPNMVCKIVDERGNEVGPRQPGEIWLKGPNLMRGYYNNRKATEATIDRDGYLHTGDIGYVDEDTNLFIVDRLKELIKYKGFQVAPAELEALLLTHADVADVAVIGKPDMEAGELPMAYVVLKAGHKVDESELISWAEKKTAPHKKLRGGIVFVSVIPKSPSGKILRRLLRATL